MHVCSHKTKSKVIFWNVFDFRIIILATKWKRDGKIDSISLLWLAYEWDRYDSLFNIIIFDAGSQNVMCSTVFFFLFFKWHECEYLVCYWIWITFLKCCCLFILRSFSSSLFYITEILIVISFFSFNHFLSVLSLTSYHIDSDGE